MYRDPLAAARADGNDDDAMMAEEDDGSDPEEKFPATALDELLDDFDEMHLEGGEEDLTQA